MSTLIVSWQTKFREQKQKKNTKLLQHHPIILGLYNIWKNFLLSN